jgi:hypothetical protein
MGLAGPEPAKQLQFGSAVSTREEMILDRITLLWAKSPRSYVRQEISDPLAR